MSAVWGSWARYVYRENPKRFLEFAKNIFGIVENGTDEEVALKGIEAMEKFYKELDMPIKISETGILLSNEDIEKLAIKCSNNKNRTIGSFKKLSYEDIKNIYSMAK